MFIFREAAFSAESMATAALLKSSNTSGFVCSSKTFKSVEIDFREYSESDDESDEKLEDNINKIANINKIKDNEDENKDNDKNEITF